MHYRVMMFAVLIFLSSCAIASENMKVTGEKTHYLGVEFQAYPAGMMPGITYAFAWNEAHEINFRAGMNFAKRNDWGVQMDERGSGFGVTLGYRYRFHVWNEVFSIGPRCDVWDLDIDYVDTRFQGPMERRSTTEILVVQPTLELAWWKQLGDSRFDLGVSLSNGYEINVKTEGLPVGEGFITLVGINARASLTK